jgi:lysozyme
VTQLIKQVKADLVRHEGKRNVAYLCTAGVWTNGVGHTGPDVFQGQRVDDKQVDLWLDKDTLQAIRDARRAVRNFDKLSFVRRTVIVNMAFNLGPTRLQGFRKMIAALEMEDYERAALEMMNSRWYAQVKGRGVELVKRMRTNTIEPRHQVRSSPPVKG